MHQPLCHKTDANNKHFNLLVNGIGVVFIKIVNSYLKLWASLTFFNGQIEQRDVGVERKLVHWINSTHIIEYKEQNRGPLCAWSVTLKTNDYT